MTYDPFSSAHAKKDMRNIFSHALFITQLPAGLEPATYALRKFIFSFWHFHDMRKSEVLSHFPRFSLYYYAMFFALFYSS